MSQAAPRPYHLRWGIHNPTVKAVDGITFGIPALKAADGFSTCPQAGRCAAICYAREGKYVAMPVVRDAREHNLSFYREKGRTRFVEAACDDLGRKRRTRVVRVHDSGDFFSQEYLEAWYEIARRNETKTFVAYTTSLHLDLWAGIPANFRLVQSEGGKLDGSIDRARAFARIFENGRVRDEAGFSNGSRSDRAVLEGATRIGLVYHGRYPPSAEQRRLFGWKADVEVAGQRVVPVPRPRAVLVARPEPEVDVRDLLSGEEARLVMGLRRILREKRENLSGRLSERELLEAKARKLDRVAGCLGELLPD